MRSSILVAVIFGATLLEAAAFGNEQTNKDQQQQPQVTTTATNPTEFQQQNQPASTQGYFFYPQAFQTPYFSGPQAFPYYFNPQQQQQFQGFTYQNYPQPQQYYFNPYYYSSSPYFFQPTQQPATYFSNYYQQQQQDRDSNKYFFPYSPQYFNQQYARPSGQQFAGYFTSPYQQQQADKYFQQQGFNKFPVSQGQLGFQQYYQHPAYPQPYPNDFHSHGQFVPAQRCGYYICRPSEQCVRFGGRPTCVELEGTDGSKRNFLRNFYSRYSNE